MPGKSCSQSHPHGCHCSLPFLGSGSVCSPVHSPVDMESWLMEVVQPPLLCIQYAGSQNSASETKQTNTTPRIVNRTESNSSMHYLERPRKLALAHTLPLPPSLSKGPSFSGAPLAARASSRSRPQNLQNSMIRLLGADQAQRSERPQSHGRFAVARLWVSHHS